MAPRGELLGGERPSSPPRRRCRTGLPRAMWPLTVRSTNDPVRGVVLLANHEGVDLTVVVAETLVEAQKRRSERFSSASSCRISSPSVATLWLISVRVKSGLKPLDVLRKPPPGSPHANRSTPAWRRYAAVELQPLALEIDRLLDASTWR